MSEQQKDQSATKPTEPAKLDATSAAVALAKAVASAERSGGKPTDAEPAKTVESPKADLPARPAGWRRHAALAAAMAVAIGPKAPLDYSVLAASAGSMLLAAVGPGAWSVDAGLGREVRRPQENPA